MQKPNDSYEPSQGLWYALAGVAAFVLGGVALANTNEADVLFPIGLVFTGSGGYLLLAGAVARGIQLARQPVESRARGAQGQSDSGQN